MGKSLTEIEALPGWELARWVAWFGRYPTSAARLDAMLAQLCALVSNEAATFKRRRGKAKIKDFLIWDRPPRNRNADELEAYLKSLAGG